MNEQRQKTPRFTVEELQAIHREIFLAGWNGEYLYEQRSSIVKKLDDFFGEHREHLKYLTR